MRKIPLFWRWIGVVFGCVLFLTGGMVLIGHAQPADPNRCLIFSDSLQNSAAVDLYTGATIGFARHYPQELVRSVYQSQPSPDGLHLAYSRYDEPSARVQLYVKATDRIGVQNSSLVQSTVGALDFAPYTPPRDFVWAPDGQWLAYWWQMPGGESFLGIADPQGRVISTQSVWPLSPSMAQSNVFFHGWSADSRYLALSVRDAATGQYTLSLWAAPTLTHVRDASYTRLKDEAITPLNDPDQLALWSTHGHQIAYLAATSDFRQLQLGVVSPERDPILTPLPVVPKVLLSNGELPTVNWSPDDRHLALIRISPVRHWLEVVDPVTQTVQVVTDQAMAMTTVDVQMYTHWSADSQTLFYAQMAASTTNPGNLDIMALHLVDHRSETLIADVYANPATTQSMKYLLFKQSTLTNGTESITAVAFNLATGAIAKIPGLDANVATMPFYVSIEASNDWIAVGDLFDYNEAANYRYINVWTLNTATGLYHHFQQPLWILDGPVSYSYFLTDDGLTLAYIVGTSDKMGVITASDNAPRIIPIYSQPETFDSSSLAPDKQQIATLFAGEFDRRVPDSFSLAIIDISSGHVRRIEPLSDRYYNLTYSACR